MIKIKEWYSGLEESEQKIVMFAGVFFGIIILLFVVLKPINEAVNLSALKVTSQQAAVEEWKDALPIIFANRGNSADNTSGQALNNIVTTSTRKFNLKLSRVEEKSANEMHVWFDNVPFNDFARWAAELENEYNIKVDSVNIRAKDRDGLSSIDIKILRG